MREFDRAYARCQRRVISVAPSTMASKIGDASAAWM
jgi:hypothetical protein